ncbi:MAG TPA: dihydroneopterin aldolase [Acidimicrobiales bacterium]|nr:dihydroneopterin aldolase [Acidimicrobiales bacterium]
MSDVIEIRGLRVLGVHGVLASEQVQVQPFELDLEIEADLAPAARADDIEATVDYGRVTDAVARVVADGHYQLLETLAVAVASAVLSADARVDGVTVALRKLRPPLPVDVSSVGVRVTRRRDTPRTGVAGR